MCMYFLDHIGIIAHNIGHNIFKILVGKLFHFGGIGAIVINGFATVTATAATKGYAYTTAYTAAITSGTYAHANSRRNTKTASTTATFPPLGNIKLSRFVYHNFYKIGLFFTPGAILRG